MIADDIQAKLFEISYLRTKLERDLKERRKELLHLAVQFDNYQDLYTYTRKTAQNLEEFNSLMMVAREIFLDK